MPELDIAKVQKDLAKLDDEIGALQAKKNETAKDYRRFLQDELAGLNGGEAPARRRRGSVKIDDEAIIGFLRMAQVARSAGDIKQAIDYDGPSSSLSVALKRLYDEERIVKEGERRASKYRIP